MNPPPALANIEMERSSRLVVLCLPPHCTTLKLRTHFSSRGWSITDVRILSKRDGTPRGVGFVGFRSDDDAAAALEYFNGSWLDGGPIKVDYARKFEVSKLSDCLSLALRSKFSVLKVDGASAAVKRRRLGNENAGASERLPAALDDWPSSLEQKREMTSNSSALWSNLVKHSSTLRCKCRNYRFGIPNSTTS